uniref:Large ribosomal subunit protein uL3c n=1 Tax=Synura sphagnicola TaxID=52556 RepID=A0A3G2QYS6_9STRA|nr:ribosomal protein L3 [Synura sphagnicola]
MSIGILGNKIGMTQVFTSKGERIPVTIIKGGPCIVTQIKSTENCGYNAVQIGYLEVSKDSKKLTKPQLGHFSKKNLPAFRYLKEYRTIPSDNFILGEEFNVGLFKIGEHVSVTGFSIGKGFTGNIKRHNFERGAMTHGSKHHRAQGSLGSGTTPGRVFPGKRMSGHSGMEKNTVTGLEIIDIDVNENLLVLKGCIPGKSGNLVSILSRKKGNK